MRFFDMNTFKNNNKLLTKLFANTEIIAWIQSLTPEKNELHELITATKDPVPLKQKEEMEHFTTIDVKVHNQNHIEVLKGEMVQAQILKSQHNSKLAALPA